MRLVCWRKCTVHYLAARFPQQHTILLFCHVIVVGCVPVPCEGQRGATNTWWGNRACELPHHCDHPVAIHCSRTWSVRASRICATIRSSFCLCRSRLSGAHLFSLSDVAHEQRRSQQRGGTGSSSLSSSKRRSFSAKGGVGVSARAVPTTARLPMIALTSYNSSTEAQDDRIGEEECQFAGGQVGEFDSSGNSCLLYSCACCMTRRHSIGNR